MLRKSVRFRSPNKIRIHIIHSIQQPRQVVFWNHACGVALVIDCFARIHLAECLCFWRCKDDMPSDWLEFYVALSDDTVWLKANVEAILCESDISGLIIFWMIFYLSFCMLIWWANVISKEHQVDFWTDSSNSKKHNTSVTFDLISIFRNEFS